MPAVSDPGYHLIGACLERGVPVEVVPGPSAAMAAAFGPDRQGAAARELTKLHEQVLRGPLAEVRERLADQGPRGELTLVVGGAPAGAAAPGANPADLAAQVAMLVEGGSSTRDAVTAVAEATGTPRRTVYQAVLEARPGPG